MTFEQAVKGSLKKWDKPRRMRSVKAIKKWWGEIGRLSCLLCYYYKENGWVCQYCGLKGVGTIGCSKEWNSIRDMIDSDTIRPYRFRRLASALYDRIEKLEDPEGSS